MSFIQRHSCNPVPTSPPLSVTIDSPPFRYVTNRSSSCYHCRSLFDPNRSIAWSHRHAIVESSQLSGYAGIFPLLPFSCTLRDSRHSCSSSGNTSSSNTLASEPLALRFFSSLLLFLFRPLACLVFLEPLAPCCVASCLLGPLALIVLRSPLAILLRRLRYSGRLPLWSEPLAPPVVVGPLALRSTAACFDRD